MSTIEDGVPSLAVAFSRRHRRRRLLLRPEPPPASTATPTHPSSDLGPLFLPPPLLQDVLVAPDAAPAELEAAKRTREVAEAELRGSESQALHRSRVKTGTRGPPSSLSPRIGRIFSPFRASLEDMLMVRKFDNRSTIGSCVI